MSKLIRKNENVKEAMPHSTKRPDLSPGAVVQHLKACQNFSKEHVGRAFDLFIKSLMDAFDIEIDNARSNEEATELMGRPRPPHMAEDRHAAVPWQRLHTRVPIPHCI